MAETWLRRRTTLRLMLSVVYLLWMAWVWYAKYLHCDDLLRERGGLALRLKSGELGRCTLPDLDFAVFEAYWIVGTLVFVGLWVAIGRANGFGDDHG